MIFCKMTLKHAYPISKTTSQLNFVTIWWKLKLCIDYFDRYFYFTYCNAMQYQTIPVGVKTVIFNLCLMKL